MFKIFLGKFFLIFFVGIVLISGCIENISLLSENFEENNSLTNNSFVESEQNNSGHRSLKSFEIVQEWSEFKNPYAIAIDSKDNIYVSEFYTNPKDNARILAELEVFWKKTGWKF